MIVDLTDVLSCVILDERQMQKLHGCGYLESIQIIHLYRRQREYVDERVCGVARSGEGGRAMFTRQTAINFIVERMVTAKVKLLYCAALVLLQTVLSRCAEGRRTELRTIISVKKIYRIPASEVSSAQLLVWSAPI